MMLLVFVGVVARRLEGENAPVMLQDIGEWRRERHLADPRAGSFKAGRAAFDQRLGRRVGALPGRGAAETDARRRRRAVDLMRGAGDERGTQQRQIIEAAAEDAERVEVVALQVDAAAAQFAEAR